MRKETPAEQLAYAELEENEEDLTNLRNWLAKAIE
ncbi:Chromate resistance protein ChrB [Amycolatopsis sp. cg13]